MAKKYRVGIIGTGGISRFHAGGWQRSRRGTLVAASDIQPQHVEGFGEEFGLPPRALYTDPCEMLRREELDCVSICTWAQHHAELVVAAARAGVRGILCEKPMCTSIGEGERMLRAAQRTGAKVAITHQRRYHRRITRAARRIARGAIGEVHTLVARGGGGLTNTHSHTVDMMRYMLGDPEPEWVMAQVERSTNRWERCYPVEDRLVAAVSFEGGVRGLIESDTPLDGAAKGGLWVYGTRGAVDVFGGPRILNRTTKGRWQTIDVAEADPPACYVKDLVRWMEGGPEPRIAIARAWATHQILMAVYESARTRSLVRFPLRNKKRILVQMIDDGTLPLKRKKKPYDIRTPEALAAGYR
ncbi:MAG: Gfo/Idh/MocA family protein [Candidatus Brocadiia bacterium]